MKKSIGFMMVMLFLTSNIWAKNKTHHFEFLKQDHVLTGEQTTLTIQCVDEKGNPVKGVSHNVTLYVVFPDRNESYDLRIRNGEAKIDLTFLQPGEYLLSVQDKADEHMWRSGSIKVEMNVKNLQGIRSQ